MQVYLVKTKFFDVKRMLSFITSKYCIYLPLSDCTSMQANSRKQLNMGLSQGLGKGI